MAYPLHLDTCDILDGLAMAKPERTEDFVREAAVWAIQNIEEIPDYGQPLHYSSRYSQKIETVSRIRHVLRRHGYDIVQKDTESQLGCKYCTGPTEFGFYPELPSSDERVHMRLFRDKEVSVQIDMSEEYTFGFHVPFNFCPVCGRELS